MVTADNFAGRLYAILARAKKVKKDSVRSMWAQSLGLDAKDTLAIYRALAILEQELSEVATYLVLTEPRYQRFIQHFPAIKAFLEVPLQADVGEAHAQIHEGVMASLEFLADKLSDCGAERIADEKTLSSVQTSLDQLEEDICHESVPLPLRVVLHDLCVSMRRSLDEFKIRGGAGLHDELFHIIAMLQRNWAVVQQHPSPVMDKAWQTIQKFEVLVSACNNSIGIAGAVQTLLAIAPAVVS